MSFTGTLLPYQEEAVDLMCERGKVLVAYDLGLGKTVLTIAAIERLRDEGKITGPGLVICLSSLKYQWANAIDKFTGHTSFPVVIDGTPKQRQAQYEQFKNSQVDYIIMNYEQVVSDWELVKKLPRAFVVADEATALKSFKSKRSKHVKKLTCPYMFALTGTPVENGKAEEIFSIMEFVDRHVLGSYPNFEAKYINRNGMGWIDGYKNLTQLHDSLKSTSVRKRQSDPDVSPYLPETIMASPLLIPFDPSGRKLYKAICEMLLEDLDEAAAFISSGASIYTKDGGLIDEFRGRIMPKLIALRQVCAHPQLLKSSGLKFDGFAGNGSLFAAELLESGVLDKEFKSPKLETLKESISTFLAEDEKNKAVIFTTFVSMTDILGKELKDHGANVYTGRMSAKEKENAKVDFQTNPGTRLLISSDAGGYGVDLPQANLLVNYDLPWNAGLALQRNGRIQRASSTWEHVVIQDLLMLGSIETRQYDMLQQKMSVANAIVDGEGIGKDGELNLTLGTLRQFLQNN